MEEVRAELQEAWQQSAPNLPDGAPALRYQVNSGDLAFGAKGEVFFIITAEGRIKVNPNIPLDTIAEDFLTSLALKKQGMDARLQFLARLEQTMILLGQADLAHEQARTADLNSTPETEHQCEMTRLTLQHWAHVVIEMGREMAQAAARKREK